MPTARSITLYLSLITCGLMLMFQNCSEVAFQDADSKSTVGGKEVSSEGEEVFTIGTEQEGEVSDSSFEEELQEEEEEPQEGEEESQVEVTPPQEEVCNPLDPLETCYAGSGDGLRGQLYYLTQAHARMGLFGDSLSEARLDDYRVYGVSVPVNIRMTSINVTPRSWKSGFRLPDGEIVKKEDGEELFEWFSLDLSGEISLPAGEYQLAMISDDGMRVTVGGEVILENDGIHAPRWDCAKTMVSFEEGESKSIQVQYFQGPQVEIAMQLLYRSAEDSSQSCGKYGQFETVPKEAFSSH